MFTVLEEQEAYARSNGYFVDVRPFGQGSIVHAVCMYGAIGELAMCDQRSDAVRLAYAMANTFPILTTLTQK